jgi:hypothetical protein
MPFGTAEGIALLGAKRQAFLFLAFSTLPSLRVLRVLWSKEKMAFGKKEQESEITLVTVLETCLNYFPHQESGLPFFHSTC